MKAVNGEWGMVNGEWGMVNGDSPLLRFTIYDVPFTSIRPSACGGESNIRYPPPLAGEG
jgi:hypothetical protein